MFTEKTILHGNYEANISNSIDYNKMPRFRWYNYKEGFSSSLVEEALDSVKIKENDFVFDPFNGNGTVTLTASLKKINSVGVEVNPFVAFMSRTKLINWSSKDLSKDIQLIINKANKSGVSELLEYSTFSELSGKEKWLFNSDVLNSFEGGWDATLRLQKNKRQLLQLALIGAAMDNCNAAKDGKCLKYKPNWREKKFSKYSFLESFKNRMNIIIADLEVSKVSRNAIIINADSRSAIVKIPHQYKLSITSPPYLNSFDYTDIYRPELFLGKFIKGNEDLKKLRYRTIRSHVEIKLPELKIKNYGSIFQKTYNSIVQDDHLWDKQIPLMIQSYFDDMDTILTSLYHKAKKGGQLWLVVANSIYSGIEIPVDLILAEIGSRKGWKMKKIEVLRYIQRRKTKHNGNLKSVRESLIIFHK